jgi:hypothetical protein
VRDQDGGPHDYHGTDEAPGPLDFDTVILPARLDSDVARRVAVASNREGISIADLLGRAAAAYDWSDRPATDPPARERARP